MNQQAGRILVVEDDPDGQIVVEMMLQKLNHPVDVRGSAEEAEVALFTDETSYAAIVLDLALPGKDGWVLLQEIQANSRTQHIPCIAVTAFYTSKLREDALNAGFRWCLPKPIDGGVLRERLQSILQEV